MNYYFSLVLALGITTFNSGQGNLALELRNPPNHHKSQLITQVTSTNVDLAANKQLESNSPESPVESAPKNLNQNLLLSAIAITGMFSAVLLLLLFKKVEINLEEEQSNSPAEDVLDDTVIMPPDINPNPAEHQEQSQDTVIVPPHIHPNPPEHQEQSQDTVIVPPYVSSTPLDAVPELIHQLQNGESKIRSHIIRKLSQSGDSSAMIPLVELIAEADTQEKSLILEAMEKITSSILKPMNQALILSLGDENSLVKQNAIRDLTRMYEIMSQVTERLSQTINDSEQKLPETTQWALKQLKQMPATPTWQLTKLINNGKIITDN